MIKPSAHRQTNGAKSSFGKAVRGKSATKQAVVRVGNRKATDDVFRRWNEGTDALEQEYAKQRARRHAYVPMGRLGVCDKCAAGENDKFNGHFIHTGIFA